MTAAEWDACDDPGAMINALNSTTGSVRKARLLAAACCRRLGLFLSPRTRDARERFLDLMESRADEPFPDNWVDAVRSDASAAEAFTSVDGCSQIESCYFMIPNAGLALGCLGYAAMYVRQAGGEGEERNQAALIRDIFGSPFRHPRFEPTWRTEAVAALAAGIYADRAFDRVPVLADALEDAGCADADLLGHCRSPGPHVRGCWAVDVVLGKE